MSRAHNTIVLIGCNRHKEQEAAVACLPGMHVELTADQDERGRPKCQPTTGTTADALKAGIRIVKEDGLQGHSIFGSGYQGTTFNVGDPVFTYQPTNGDEINLLVKDGEQIEANDYLVPEGGGTGLWIKATGAETRFPFRALESLTPTGENDFIACEYQG